MPKTARTVREPTFLAALFVLVLLVGSSANAARAASPLGSQVTLTNVDPNGQGVSTFSVYYSLPQQASVGSPLVVPVYLYVDNLTKLMVFLFDYSVQISVSLNNGKQISGQAGVNSTEAADNLGALQLHEGESWGPTNVTIPLTPSNTGLAQGQEALGTATLTVNADVWFNEPINFYRPQANQTSIGNVVFANGTPSGPQPNYLGFVLVGLGAVIVAATVITRRKKPSSPKPGAPQKKAPGSV